MSMNQTIMHFEIRRALPTDLYLLAPLFDRYRQFYGRESDVAAAYGFLKDRIERDESVVFLAHDDGTALGFAQLYPTFSSLSLARRLVLNDLFVAEQARRLGVGRALIAVSAEYGRTVGAIGLELSTAKSNERAQALYRSTGWVRDEVYDHYSLTLR